MSILEATAAAKKVWFDEEYMWLEMTDGRQLAVPLPCFPRLLHASPEQRRSYELSGGGTGIHWDGLDEDISVAGLLFGIGDRTSGLRAMH